MEEEPIHKHKNINVRAAFIHVVGDIIQSLGVLVAALIIKFTVSILKLSYGNSESLSEVQQNFFNSLILILGTSILTLGMPIAAPIPSVNVASWN